MSEQPPQFSRRDFLGLTAKSAGAVVGSAVGIDKIARAGFSVDQTNEQLDLSRKARELKDRISKLSLEKIKEYGGRDRNQRTCDEQEKVRKDFLEEFDSVLTELFDIMNKCNFQTNSAIIIESMNGLEQFDAHGIMIKYAFDNYPAHAAELCRYTNRVSARAADYLPTAETVSDLLIDQRHVFDRGRRIEIVDEQQDILYKYKGWSALARKGAFRELLDDTEIRSIIAKSDCTVAEALSVIKAVVVRYELLIFQGEQNIPTRRELVEYFLDEREKFKKREILGDSVQQVIRTTYSNDPKVFDPQLLPNLVAATDMEERQKIIKTDQYLLPPDIALSQAIANSNGQTTVWIEAHGQDDYFMFNESDNCTATELAKAFLKRLYKTQDINTFSQMTVVHDSCLGHNFVRKVVEKIKELFDSKKFKLASIEELIFPTIITAAQEGSLAASTTIMTPLKEQMKAVEESNNLDGRFFMARVQPSPAYYLSDVTIFVGKKGGIEEIG